MIKMINESIGDLAPSKRSTAGPATAKAPTPTPPPPPAPEKWSRENHPAFRKQAQEEKERAEAAAQAAAAQAALAEAPVHYTVNDPVLAKWISGDKGFYPARITAVTGSSTQPIYTVKFKSYDTVETLRAKDIKPVSNKRKADGTGATGSGSSGAGSSEGTSPTVASPSSSFPSVNSSAAASNNGIVLQSAPSVYPQAEQQPADGEKPVKKFKKIKATKELEKGKNKWQEFTTKGKFGKAAKKDSMFRTPEGVHGRGMSRPLSAACRRLGLDVLTCSLSQLGSRDQARPCARILPGVVTSTILMRIMTKMLFLVAGPSIASEIVEHNPLGGTSSHVRPLARSSCRKTSTRWSATGATRGSATRIGVSTLHGAGVLGPRLCMSLCTQASFINGKRTFTSTRRRLTRLFSHYNDGTGAFSQAITRHTLIDTNRGDSCFREWAGERRGDVRILLNSIIVHVTFRLAL